MFFAKGRPNALRLALLASAYLSVPAGLRAQDIQIVDNLVLNPDFTTDLQSWTEATPGIDQWQSADFIYPDPYVRIYIAPATAGDHAGLTQCMFLPRPAIYQLTGLARGGSYFGATNTPRINWRLFFNADANCSNSGYEGDVEFAATGAFAPPLVPLRILLSPEQWTPTTAMRITLIDNTDVALANHASVADFDSISLTGFLIDEIFKGDFEELPAAR